MGPASLELPADLVFTALLNNGHVSKEAELGRTPLAAFMKLAAAHGVSPIRFTGVELEEDRRTLAELGRATSS
jgi:hypothetical protein